jgi:hypothetical protein
VLSEGSVLLEGSVLSEGSVLLEGSVLSDCSVLLEGLGLSDFLKANCRCIAKFLFLVKVWVRVMVFNNTFNNISAIAWWLSKCVLT